MGNVESSPRNLSRHGDHRHRRNNEAERDDDDTDTDDDDVDPSMKLPSFPGSALVDAAMQCGNIEDSISFEDDHHNHSHNRARAIASHLLSRAELCVMSPVNSDIEDSDNKNNRNRFKDGESISDHTGDNFFDNEYEEFGRKKNKSSITINTRKEPKYTNTNNDNSSSKHDKGAKKNISNTDNISQMSSSGLLAKALASEVNKNRNPKTMTPAEMVEREKRLLKAQKKARLHNKNLSSGNGRSANNDSIASGWNSSTGRPIGSPTEGVGKPSVLGSIAHALTGSYNDPLAGATHQDHEYNNDHSFMSQIESQRASASRGSRNQLQDTGSSSPSSVIGPGSRGGPFAGKHTVTIALSLSRRSSTLGHPDTVTRQTAFDFNELQDREYKYVSSTDSSGWRAGGGERGGASTTNSSAGNRNGNPNFFGSSGDVDGVDDNDCKGATTYNKDGKTSTMENSAKGSNAGTPKNEQDNHKIAAPDTVHIPIIQIDAESSQAVDAIISALARGEIFIPHMAIIPEALSVNGVSPPDLVVRFGTERNEDLPPDEWPNWCLEFMHNQLYEYFHGMGAQWAKRPFSIKLARKVRWKTVKHMNRYFAHAERVIDAWREKGPQYLDPQLSYIEGGATPEEVARPHGIYLLRNGIPTNYFAPNFDPPYTTKMTRSLLFNVLGKSWDKKRREWTSTPIPKLITPSMLVTAMCSCTDNPAHSGFMATEATYVTGPPGRSTTVPDNAVIHSVTPRNDSDNYNQHEKKKKKNHQRKNQGVSSIEKIGSNSNNDNNNSNEIANDTAAASTMMMTTSDVLLVPLSENDEYQMRTANVASTITVYQEKEQQEQEKVTCESDNRENLTQPQEPTSSNSFGADPFVGVHDDDESRGNNNSNNNLTETNTDIDILQAKLELQISSSSASFFDNSESGIPSPPHSESAANERADAVTVSQKGQDFVEQQTQQNTNLLKPREGRDRSNQDKTNQHQPRKWLEAPEVTDENSGDSANHQQQNNKSVHTKNMSKKKNQHSETTKTLASDDDWLNNFGESLKLGKGGNDPVDFLEGESQRHLQVVPMAYQMKTPSLTTKRTDPLFDTFRHSNLSPTVRSNNNSKNSGRNAALRLNHSGSLSMEYSHDDSSHMNGDKSVGESTWNSAMGSTLLGQHYSDGSASVISVATKETTTTREALDPDPLQQVEEVKVVNVQQRQQQNDDTHIGSMDTDSYEDEPVPTDEELFVAGWAKALDNSSGSYYYFTLDRTKTVWDNPLAPFSESRSDDSVSAGEI